MFRDGQLVFDVIAADRLLTKIRLSVDRRHAGAGHRGARGVADVAQNCTRDISAEQVVLPGRKKAENQAGRNATCVTRGST